VGFGLWWFGELALVAFVNILLDDLLEQGPPETVDEHDAAVAEYVVSF